MKQNDNNSPKVCIIGAGLAGSDAAFFLASRGVKVVIADGKKLAKNPAQKMETSAELVCTNSLKSKDPSSGHGLLKTEMKKMGSLILECGELHAVPAGDALAVDREKFSEEVHGRLQQHPQIEFVIEDVKDPLAFGKEHGAQFVIVATGPLTNPGLETWILENLSKDDFYFYDAIAPVVDADSLDYSQLYFKDRHKPFDPESGEADYLNAPMNQEQYEKFIDAMISAEKVPAQNFEDYQFFEACLPIDLLAERGMDTARFGCMKPIGLELPGGKRPYACVQLRKENLLGSAYNLVGFQTRLKYPEQKRIFRMIPGFEDAQFIHLGSVHRNSYLNSSKLLNHDLSSREYPGLHFAGQMTGVEGYTESAACGLYVAYQVLRKIRGKDPVSFPVETGIGALVNYLMTAEKLVPTNINFGLLPPVGVPLAVKRKRPLIKKMKKNLASLRAKQTFERFWNLEGLP